jgi:hypothetical protein
MEASGPKDPIEGMWLLLWGDAPDNQAPEARRPYCWRPFVHQSTDSS